MSAILVDKLLGQCYIYERRGSYPAMKDRRELFRVDVEGKKGRAPVVPVGGLLMKKGLDMQVYARFEHNHERGS